MPTVLVFSPLADHHLALIRERYDTIYAPTADARQAAIAAQGHRVQAVLTLGSVGLTAAQMDAMPKLELVSALGAGYERIDVEAARARGIVLSNGAGTNDTSVADHAFALLLAVVRDIPRRDASTHAGNWRGDFAPPPGVSGKRLGILGLGTIGRRIARRAEGFDMQIGYHGRQRQEDSPYAYFDSPLALAGWSDFLIVATPGGSATRHLVGAEVLRALGPQGFLVNIARGSVVDTDALAAALDDGIIAGAGIDVYETEPPPLSTVAALGKALLSPHMAGSSPEAIRATVDQFVENAELHFSGRPVRTPI